jgi:hypothetical protein
LKSEYPQTLVAEIQTDTLTMDGVTHGWRPAMINENSATFQMARWNQSSGDEFVEAVG